MDPYFFPNQSPDIMRLDERFRAQVARLDEAARLELYAILSAIGPTFTPTTFSHEDGLTVAHQADRRLHFPSPTPVKVLSHILCGYEEWLRRKYCLPGFVEVEPDDVVIDCGAYVSNFMLAAQALGLGTIPQAALAHQSGLIRRHFNLGDDRRVVCGISFGFADNDHRINSYRTSRASVADVAAFVDE